MPQKPGLFRSSEDGHTKAGIIRNVAMEKDGKDQVDRQGIERSGITNGGRIKEDGGTELDVC